MKKIMNRLPWKVMGTSSILGAIIFIMIYGINVLDCTYVDWLMNSGDLTSHYLGWEYYRDSAWQFPIGFIDNYIYPIGSSIVNTDSIPIFAIVFKLLETIFPIFPERFQYFGYWGILSFMLQGAASSLILYKFIKNKFIVAISSIFFIISPIMISRMFGHTALAGQWIILIGIAVFVYKNSLISLKSNVVIWTIICCLAVLIHPYFLCMLGVLLVGYLIKDFGEYNDLKRVILILISAMTSTVLVFWIIGGFVGGGGSEIGLGNYSMNINALFNPQGWSRFINDLPLATEGQYEGFQYLGLGVIILLFIALFLDINVSKQRLKAIFNKNNLYLFFIVIVLSVLAISKIITIGDRVLLEINLPNKIEAILSIFRSSGRLFWPIYYLVLLCVIVKTMTYKHSMKTNTLIIVGILGIQVLDISKVLIDINSRFPKKIVYNDKLQADFWSDYNEKYRHIMLLPSNKIEDILGYEALAWKGITNGSTLNAGYGARLDWSKIGQYSEMMEKELRAGNINPETLYVTQDIRWLANIVNDIKSKGNKVIDVDGYYVILEEGAFEDNEYKDVYEVDMKQSGQYELTDYINRLKEDAKDKILIISVRDEASSHLNEEILNTFKSIGVETNLMGKFRESYIGIIDLENQRSIYEEIGNYPIEYNITANNPIKERVFKQNIKVTSAGAEVGDFASIIINNRNYSFNYRGMNMVVYDLEDNRVKEIAHFDSYAQTKGNVIIYK